MSSSKVLADRTMLDIRAIILSLRYAANALENGKGVMKNQGKEILEVVTKDIQSVEEDHIMADSLDTYYSFSIDEQSALLHSVVDNIEKGFFEDARKTLETLVLRAEEKLNEHLRESVS